MKRIKCKSGIEGWEANLRENYATLEEWAAYAETYGLHTRLGFATPQEAWEENPLVQGSVHPADFRLSQNR